MRLLTSRISSKPHYVFHPGRAARRLMHRFDDSDGQRRLAALPWGLPLEVYTSDAIGFSIVAGGVFDPCVTETLHRLIDPSELVIDVGANVGYLTSLAAVRVGPDGKVVAFEPHPRVFELLGQNAARWRGSEGVGDIDLHRIALSDQSGDGTLVAGPSFETNMGLAALGSGAPPTDGSDAIPVTLARLDDFAPDYAQPRLIKIDVEGHEAEVLRGARDLLATGVVRDVIFEDHDAYPSEATAIIEEAGYHLISLENDLFGLRLGAPKDRGAASAWPGPSYLATLDPARAESRLAQRGWKVRGIGPTLTWRRRKTCVRR